MTSLVIQRLRLHALNAGVPSSIPGQGTRSRMPQLRVHMLQLRPGNFFFFLRKLLRLHNIKALLISSLFTEYAPDSGSESALNLLDPTQNPSLLQSSHLKQSPLPQHGHHVRTSAVIPHELWELLLFPCACSGPRHLHSSQHSTFYSANLGAKERLSGPADCASLTVLL